MDADDRRGATVAGAERSSRRRPARWASVVAVLLVLSAPAACAGGSSEGRARGALTAEPDGAALPLRAEFGGSSCADLEGWEVEETASEVEVRAVVRVEGGECTADLVIQWHTVRLSSPLGERRLVGCDPDDDDADCAAVAQR